MRPLHAPFTPGLPPAGPSSAFIGRDAHGNLYLLRWHETNGWEALGWVGAGKAAMPALRHPAGQDQGLIVGHVELGIVVDAAALDHWAHQWIRRLRPETDERKTFGDGYFSGAIHVLGELRSKLREVGAEPQLEGGL